MIASLRKARVLLEVQYAYMLEYRAEIILWALAGILPFLMMGIWVSASAGGDFPLQELDFARYFVGVFIVRQFTIVWVLYAFEGDVVHGRLSPMLLQPMNPVWRYVSAHLSEQATRAPWVALILLGFFLVYPEALWAPSVSAVLLTLLATYTAFTMRFTLQYCVSMLCFWTERAQAVERVIFIPYLFLSGFVAPLDVFPPAVAEFAMWTPFPYLLYVPARILVGAEVDLVHAFGVMIAWTVVFLLLCRWLWRLGLRHYSAMGA